MAGIGPGPFCCMMLADMGAEVIRVDRTEPADLGLPSDPEFQFLNRGKRSIALDLKSPAALTVVKRLIEEADVLVEGFRPGVMERLGLGPAECEAINPALVYGRITGWGQSGPLARSVGHDINYIALTGALDAIGSAGGPPVPPLNLVGDFGGGGAYLAFGVLCALVEAKNSGKGQVVDAAIVDGTVHLMTSLTAAVARGAWPGKRGENVLDGGAPWYGVYRTKDGRHVCVGAIEARFYRELLAGLGFDSSLAARQHDRSGWPELRSRFEAAFLERTRDEWAAHFETTNACVSPVLDLKEAAEHPHLRARSTFTEVGSHIQPAPAPRFSRSKAEIRRPPPTPGQDGSAILAECGFSRHDIVRLEAEGAFGATREANPQR